MMVADAFDAMTSDRSYRKALPIDRALGELQKYSGTQFLTDVVETILAMHERGEFDIIPDSDIQQVICEIQRVSDPDTKTKVQPQPAPQATHDEPVEKQVETEVHTVP
jgi:hypothetical protein